MRRITIQSVFSMIAIASFCMFAVNAHAAQGDCGQPTSNGSAPTAVDCLYILQASVGSQTCTPECICDVSGGGGVNATDALVCLTAAVASTPIDACPCSGTSTTTLPPPVGPPGVGDVINESCAVCHADGRLADIPSTHPGLQTFADTKASIDGVTIDVDDGAETATLTVDFTVTDANGDPVRDLGAASTRRPDRFAYVRFALSELIPAGAGTGDPDMWVSYTTGDRNPDNLTDNGDGTYTYTFDTNLYELYDPAQRHRLLLILSGDIFEQSKNVHYDFVPAQLPGPFTFNASRDIVATVACNDCHGRLGSTLGGASFHGGSRYTTESCATCHTSELGGGVVEFTPLVHKVHTSQVVSEDPEDPLDFSEVTFPQDPRNCVKCHAGPDADNWKTRPSILACGSCHEDVNFETGEGHVGGDQADNAGCAFCHTSQDIEENHITDIASAHNPEVPEGLSNFEWVLEEVTVNQNNEAVVTFHINKDGEPLDLTTEFPPAGFGRGPSFLLAYALPQDGVAAPADYNNLGRSAGQPAGVSLSTLAPSLTGTPESYTAVLSDEPFPIGASLRAVALQGYFTQSFDLDKDGTPEDIRRQTASVVRAVAGDEARREIVDNAKCLNCHENLALHGGNRVNQVQVCVMCHNPNLSSSGRAADTTETADSQKEALAEAGFDPDNALTWPEATQQFKSLVHGIHGADARSFDYEFVRNRQNGIYYNWSEVTFPGILSNCETCHLPGTYGADLPDGQLLTTDITTDGLNLTQDAVDDARDSVPNPTDLVHSETAGTCYMCHNSDPATAHMGQNGGVLDVWRAQALGD